MHAYDVPRRQSLQPIPSARSGQDHSGGPSATPIYDALYAEYVKSFRALPGDRRGEENLQFIAFGYLTHGSGSQSGSYSAYSAGAQSTRHHGGHQPTWQRVGTIGQQHSTGTHHVPALPPGPRRGI
ncbi:hypothetical protein SSP24_43080 [Streptomyces spinoverrucosus]|uniref:Uncharacterized protein n=1 Tax=Streptomyces spinoverrucosus TaxID=284043 RepID=A0A4Y3VJD1_9ACTN|nr:hypothetical protein [Streptomyces spinoverrucosus]GEC06653.1 hypothetical protein SSP24_43080 [Streptomyces spinoverrucosus]GHB56128.1 hypothetical protein GCM10010397_27880 [Streptomyces spinoverrucosus]